MKEPIPVIDIFAGPGGLGEGFTSVYDENNKRSFKIALSIEKEEFAHQTLELRSFYRQYEKGKAPEEYYKFLRGEISREDLFCFWPAEAKSAKEDAWRATLGETDEAEIDDRIKHALNGRKNWVLIGGPPCQAYSIVGRARHQLKENLNEDDPRVFLYREYYRILAVHNPPVFIMENVKGLLSSKLNDEHFFNQILSDLQSPSEAYQKLRGKNKNIFSPGYNIFSFVKEPDIDSEGNFSISPKDFVIKAEEYGIPQRRHRIVLLGIRKDIISFTAELLNINTNHISVKDVIEGLPKLRSGLSKEFDSITSWSNAIKRIGNYKFFNKLDANLKNEIFKVILKIGSPELNRGSEFIEADVDIRYKPEWYLDKKIKGVCNHSTRAHIRGDLLRYLYASSFAYVNMRSPKLLEFPGNLLPKHLNKRDNKFSDRFRVQLENKPATTITSHISKDGHYYIHYDSFQCRSLTVREAARIQTFPDNYFFCGPRTAQYTQVGNAVPPLLAQNIASIVEKYFNI